MMNMKKLLAAILFTCLSSLCFAEVAVIVHPSANFSSMDKNDIARIYLGRTKSLPDGVKAEPVDQQAESNIRETFLSEICKKSTSQYKAYWSKLVFTGKGTPPKEVTGDAAVKSFVAGNPGAIGYVDASAVDSSVKVVYRIP